MLETILAALDNVMRSNGAKVPKRKFTKSIIMPYREPSAGRIEDDVPNINVLLQQYGGGAVLDMNTLEDFDNGKHS